MWLVVLASLATLALSGIGAATGPSVALGPVSPLATEVSALSPPTVLANGSGWENLTNELAPAMPDSALGAMAYDPTISSDVMIPSSYGTDCTYLYSHTGWTCTHSTPYPYGQIAPSLAWDNGTQTVVAYGGEDPITGGLTSETWAYANGSWTALNTGAAPLPRFGAALAWDPSDGYLVLFGGTNGTSVSNETWALNGTSWVPLTPSVSPPARSGAVFAEDPAIDADVLFGGNGTGGVPLNDTWIFQRGTWHELSFGSSPSPRVDAIGAYDPTIRSVVVFGGGNASNEADHDTWFFDGAAWIGPYPLTFPIPSAREAGVMAVAPSGNGLLLFGGQRGSGRLNDSWLFYTVAPTVQVQPYEGEGPVAVNFTSDSTAGIPPLTYAWTFGDGASEYAANVTHVYAVPGRYPVELTVTDAYGVQGHYNLTLVDVADFGFDAALSPTLGHAPLQVMGTSTPSDGAAPYAVTWHFASGATVAGTSAMFTYSLPGTYSVVVWGNDSFGRAIERTFSVDVLGSLPAPTVNVTLLANRTLAVAPAAVGFAAAASGASSVLGFTWSFGDGTGTVGPRVSHVYDAPGTYVVTLTALNAVGGSGTTSRAITVAAPLSVDANDSVTPQGVGDLVTLRAIASGGIPPYQYFWQFANGTGAEGANVTLLTTESGALPVRLETIDAAGDVAWQSLSVPVAGSHAPGPGPSSAEVLPWGAVTIVAVAAALGFVVGAAVAVVVTRQRRSGRVRPGRSARAPRGPTTRVPPRAPTGRSPSAPRSPPGRSGDARRPPPPSR